MKKKKKSCHEAFVGSSSTENITIHSLPGTIAYILWKHNHSIYSLVSRTNYRHPEKTLMIYNHLSSEKDRQQENDILKDVLSTTAEL